MRCERDETLTAAPHAAGSRWAQLLIHASFLAAVLALFAAVFAMPLGRALADDAPPAGDIGAKRAGSDEAAAEVAAGGVTATQPARMADDPRLKRLGHTVLWSVVLLLVFISAAIAIIVFSRRYRQYLSQTTRHEKTEYVDVWKLHKVPENLDIEPDDEGDKADEP